MIFKYRYVRLPFVGKFAIDQIEVPLFQPFEQFLAMAGDEGDRHPQCRRGAGQLALAGRVGGGAFDLSHEHGAALADVVFGARRIMRNTAGGKRDDDRKREQGPRRRLKRPWC